jgi:hypothetical protein
VVPAPAGPQLARSSRIGIPFGWPIPAGLLEGSRLLDAPPHHVTAALKRSKSARSYEFFVLFTSTVGWEGDQRLAEAIKAANPAIKIAFVGPPVTTSPDKALNECDRAGLHLPPRV